MIVQLNVLHMSINKLAFLLSQNGMLQRPRGSIQSNKLCVLYYTSLPHTHSHNHATDVQIYKMELPVLLSCPHPHHAAARSGIVPSVGTGVDHTSSFGHSTAMTDLHYTRR